MKTNRRLPVSRSGFSLIELLIVIVVIAILASLLLGAVNNARLAARETAVVQDIKAFEKAIADFKFQFGVEPPSFIVLYEQGTGHPDQSWLKDTTAAWRDGARRSSRATLREMWPQFDFSLDVDIDGDGTIKSDGPLVLNGAECLAFFIGGMQQQVTLPGGEKAITARGFSSNPATPFSGYTGNRIGPFHEMDPLRFVNLDSRAGHSIYEYMDSFPGQSKPIQYFSSYGGQGYRPFGLVTDKTTTTRPTNDTAASNYPDSQPEDDEVLYVGSTPTLRSVYHQAPGTSGSVPPVPFKENGYQLISPGFDGDYGFGGYCHGQNGCATDPAYVDPDDRSLNIQYERDNITNFKSGKLN